MITTFWDICLLIVGVGTFLCVPLLLLATIGLLLTSIIKAITPSQTKLAEPTVYSIGRTHPENESLNTFEWEALASIDLPELLQVDAHQQAIFDKTQLPEQTEGIAVAAVPNTWQSILRWIAIILVYTIAYGLSMLVIQVTAKSLPPIAGIVFAIFINTFIIFIGLAGMRISIKGDFTEFLGLGWFVGIVISMFSGSFAGIFVWVNEARCIDPVCVYSSQVIGLTVGMGVLLFLISLVEWWDVWGEKYLTGRWSAGISIGLIVAVLLYLVGAHVYAIIFGWMACALIVTSGARGDSFYERRLLGIVPLLFVCGYVITALGTVIAVPNCLCVDDLNKMAWRWLVTGAATGALSGIAWLYLWQISPLKEKAYREEISGLQDFMGFGMKRET